MAFDDISLIEDNLVGTSWLGEIVDINDPKKEGRVRIKIFGKFDELEIEHIPWARPIQNITGGSKSGGGTFSVPKLGAIVNVKFNNGNKYEPEYESLRHISDELKDEIRDSYENAHSLIYDTVTEGGLKMFFVENKGLILDYKGSQLNIKPDNSILIQNPNGDSVLIENNGACTINMQEKVTINTTEAIINAKKRVWLDSPKIELGKNAIESVIKGNTFQLLFNTHTHVGNLGAPTTPPMIPLNGSELSKVSKTQ